MSAHRWYSKFDQRMVLELKPVPVPKPYRDESKRPVQQSGCSKSKCVNCGRCYAGARD